MGSQAGLVISTGIQNVLIGALAGDALTDADSNVAIGYNALTADTKGNNSVAIGQGTLATQNFTSSTDTHNVAIGRNAGGALTTGDKNIFIGGFTGDGETSGSRNTAIGYAALTDMNTATTAYNTALGYHAGNTVTNGFQNTFVGGFAGDSCTTGDQNVCIGYESDVDNNNRVNSVAIGQGVGTFAADNSFRVIGAGGVYHTGNTSSWSTTSDERIKKNITDSTVGLADINKIKVRNFEYRTADEITDSALQAYDKTQLAVSMSGKQVGCIAQELEIVLPSAVTTDDRGIKNVQVDEIHWHMIKAIQELSAKNDALEARIKTLEGS